jgi:hypothetical protein
VRTGVRLLRRTSQRAPYRRYSGTFGGIAVGVVAALAALFAATPVSALDAARVEDRILDPQAHARITFENTVNVASYQQDAVLTFEGYQYTAWYQNDGPGPGQATAVVARRQGTRSARDSDGRALRHRGEPRSRRRGGAQVQARADQEGTGQEGGRDIHGDGRRPRRRGGDCDLGGEGTAVIAR